MFPETPPAIDAITKNQAAFGKKPYYLR